MGLADQLWLAELGKPQTVWVYDLEDNHLDVMKYAPGIAYRLHWKLDEKELALYDSERTAGSPVPAEAALPALTCTLHNSTFSSCKLICCG